MTLSRVQSLSQVTDKKPKTHYQSQYNATDNKIQISLHLLVIMYECETELTIDVREGQIAQCCSQTV